MNKSKAPEWNKIQCVENKHLAITTHHFFSYSSATFTKTSNCRTETSKLKVYQLLTELCDWATSKNGRSFSDLVNSGCYWTKGGCWQCRAAPWFCWVTIHPAATGRSAGRNGWAQETEKENDSSLRCRSFSSSLLKIRSQVGTRFNS